MTDIERVPGYHEVSEPQHPAIRRQRQSSGVLARLVEALKETFADERPHERTFYNEDGTKRYHLAQWGDETREDFHFRRIYLQAKNINDGWSTILEATQIECGHSASYRVSLDAVTDEGRWPSAEVLYLSSDHGRRQIIAWGGYWETADEDRLAMLTVGHHCLSDCPEQIDIVKTINMFVAQFYERNFVTPSLFESSPQLSDKE